MSERQTYYGTKRVIAWPGGKLVPTGRPGEQRLEQGYSVVYEDGHRSWSPKEAFEKAYQPVSAMDFGRALQAVKDGHRVRRASWPKGYPDFDLDRQVVIDADDILAEDWHVLPSRESDPDFTPTEIGEEMLSGAGPMADGETLTIKGSVSTEELAVRSMGYEKLSYGADYSHGADATAYALLGAAKKAPRPPMTDWLAEWRDRQAAARGEALDRVVVTDQGGFEEFCAVTGWSTTDGVLTLYNRRGQFRSYERGNWRGIRLVEGDSMDEGEAAA